MQDKLLTLSAAARRLGVSRWTLRRWLFRGELRAVRVGGRLRVPLLEVRRLARSDALRRRD